MKSVKTIFTLFIALNFFIQAQLYAAPLMMTSPQKDSTSGRLGSDTDDFMSPRNYTGLNFDTWFGAVSFFEGRPIPDVWSNFGGTDIVQLGFAVKPGGVYIGVYYGGNLYRNFGKTPDGSVFHYTEQEVSFFSSPKTMKVYNGKPEIITGERNIIYNEFAVLLGIADMGFRLAYSTNYQNFSCEDFAVNPTGTDNYAFYKSWFQEFGVINPEIAWAVTKDIFPGIGFKPELKVNFIFNRDNRKEELYTALNDTNGEKVEKSMNHFNLGVSAGLGGFTFSQVNNFKWGADLDYSGNFYFYDNEYTYTGADYKNHTGKIKGELLGAGQLYLKSRHVHSLVPSINASWSDNRIRLSGRFGLGLSYRSLDEKMVDVLTGSVDGTLVNHGPDKTTTVFGISPVFNLGLQWGIIPEKFFLNAGGTVTLGAFSFETIDQRGRYDQGTLLPGTTQTAVNTTFTTAKTGLTFGFSFYPMDHFGIQFTCGVDAGDNSVNVFNAGSGGMFNFANILATVKF